MAFPRWDIQVIAPTRVGALGTGALNALLQTRSIPPAPTRGSRLQGVRHLPGGGQGDADPQQLRHPLPLGRRDKSTGIFNGDIGVIETIDRAIRTLTIRFDDRVADYSFEMLTDLELAYAITVHKSQGSEFEAVILPLMNYRSKMYYRNLLYTAVTRAKRLLILVGSDSRCGTWWKITCAPCATPGFATSCATGAPPVSAFDDGRSAWIF